MAKNYQVALYYGWQETEDGTYHAFSAEDPDKLPNKQNIANELAALLDTTPEDQRFNWNSMNIRIPDSVVAKIRAESMEMARQAMQPPVKKPYTLDSFRAKIYSPHITAVGHVADSSTRADWCINYSSILTKLIQIAGRLVDSYASDMIITWNTVMADLDAGIRIVREGKCNEDG